MAGMMPAMTMEEQVMEHVRAVERQNFVKYVVVADRAGFPITVTGNATPVTAAYVREVMNCVEEMFPDQASGQKRVMIEGVEQVVVITERGPYALGVEIAKDMFN